MGIRFSLIRIVSRFHVYIYRISRGRVGKQIGALRFLLLTTVGRKSGKKRTVPLTAIPYGSKYILVASFGGSSVHPAWLTNIQKNPNVEIRDGTTVKQAKASIVGTTHPSHKEMWGKAAATYAGYNDYKKATSRRIPIVIITPYED